MKSKVTHIKVKNDVFTSVKKAMDLANWKKYIKPKKIFIKINALSHQVVPGHCTSPWVLEAVIKILKNFEIYVGDANVATIKQLDKASLNWGYKKICDEHNAKFINLSKQKTEKINFNGKIIKKIHIPKILLDVDSIITLPVVKTHNVSIMTCALKNQWGCLPKFRHNYHLKVHEVIPEINKILKVNFCVADATICSEGSGPRTGKPIICDSIFASNDLVALDTAVANFIGLDPNKIPYVKIAQDLGVGSMDYKAVGDKININKFEPALASKHPIVFFELKLRKIPLLNKLIFKTSLFNIPAFIASRYNTLIWHNSKGKKYTKKILNHPYYKEEFKNLIK